MNMHMSGSLVYLGGDWTLTGVTQKAINSLAVALQQIGVGCETGLKIDCRDISAIDITGQQMLNLWMQCASLRGVEPELVNPPHNLLQSFQWLGLVPL